MYSVSSSCNLKINGILKPDTFQLVQKHNGDIITMDSHVSIEQIFKKNQKLEKRFVFHGRNTKITL